MLFANAFAASAIELAASVEALAEPADGLAGVSGATDRRSDAFETRSIALEHVSSALEHDSSSIERCSNAFEQRSDTVASHSDAPETRPSALETCSIALEERSGASERCSTGCYDGKSVLHRSVTVSALLFAACGGMTTSVSESGPGSVSSSGGGGSSSGSTSGPPDAGPVSFSAPATIYSAAPASPQLPPMQMVSDGVDLFMTLGTDNQSFDELWRMPVAGGAPVRIASEVLPVQDAILAVDATSVYFVQGTISPTSQPTTVPVSIASVPKQGGAASVLFTSPAFLDASATGGIVTWAEGTPDGDASVTVTVKSAPLVAGGRVTTLGEIPDTGAFVWNIEVAASGSAAFLAWGQYSSDGTTQAGALQVGVWTPWEGAASQVSTLLAGDGGVYGFGGGTPLDFISPNGTTTTISTGTQTVGAMALDATNVYWLAQPCDESVLHGCTAPPNNVETAPRRGGTNVTLASYANDTIGPEFDVMAVDDAAVYWSVCTAPKPNTVVTCSIERSTKLF